MEGIKYDDGKPRWDLLPMEEVEEIVKVLTHGAKKYSDDNWMHVEPFRKRYFSAMMRHLIDRFYKGERMDKDSGLSHMAHAGCCLLFLMWHDKHNDETEKIV